MMGTPMDWVEDMWQTSCRLNMSGSERLQRKIYWIEMQNRRVNKIGFDTSIPAKRGKGIR